jgi:hypothetical protein
MQLEAEHARVLGFGAVGCGWARSGSIAAGPREYQGVAGGMAAGVPDSGRQAGTVRKPGGNGVRARVSALLTAAG